MIYIYIYTVYVFDIATVGCFFLPYLPRTASDCHLEHGQFLSARGARQESMREQSQKLQAASEKSQDLEAARAGAKPLIRAQERTWRLQGGYGNYDSYGSCAYSLVM